MIYDINLIPKAKKRTSNTSILLITTLILCLVAFTSYYGVFVPMQKKYILNNQIKAQEAELLVYSDTLASYDTLIEETDSLKTIDVLLDMIKDSDLNMTELFHGIENSMPDKITFHRLNLTDNLLTIEATASSYREIAQFIVKLRNIEMVENVIFMNAKLGSAGNYSDFDSESSDGESTQVLEKQSYDFTLNVTLNNINIANRLEEGSASIETGGEVSTDEIN